MNQPQVKTIIVRDESETNLAGWWIRKGERYISSWLTINDAHKNWFDREMVKRYGADWKRKQDEDDD